jgi:hypothetical protein
MKLAKYFFWTGFFILLAMEIVLGLWLQNQIDKLNSSIRSNSDDKELRTLLAQETLSEESEQQALDQELAEVKSKTKADPALNDETDPSLSKDFQIRFAANLQNPTFLKLLKLQQKALLDARYSVLFDQLNLTPQQLDQFKNLLVEKQLDKTDALIAARELGSKSGGEAIPVAQDDEDTQIHSLLGDSGYAQYQNYEATSNVRATVNRLQQALSYTSTPLTDGQASQLVELWYQALPPSEKNHIAGPSAALGAGLLAGGNSPMADIPPSGLDVAKTILAPAQTAAVQHLMTIQQAQAQLKKLASTGGPQN